MENLFLLTLKSRSPTPTLAPLMLLRKKNRINPTGRYPLLLNQSSFHSQLCVLGQNLVQAPLKSASMLDPYLPKRPRDVAPKEAPVQKMYTFSQDSQC